MKVLLLPGSLCDERLFEHQIDALEAARHDVEFCELRPHISIESMAAHIVETVQGPFVAIGLSLGGIVVAELATQCPERLLGAVVMATNLAAPSSEQLARRHAWENHVRSGKLWQIVAQELVPVQTSFPERNGQLIFAMAEEAASAGFLSENKALLHRHDLRDVLGASQVPTLIVCGDEDLVCQPAVHRDLAERTPGAELALIERAGHLLTIDQPSTVSNLLLGWIEHLSYEIHTQEGNHAYDHA